MDKQIYKLIKNDVPVQEISKILNIPQSEIFRKIISSYTIDFPYLNHIRAIDYNSIIKINFTFKELGLKSYDINSNLSFLFNNSITLKKRHKLYIDNIQKYDFRKRTISDLKTIGIPLIFSYVVPSTKKIPTSIKREFKIIDYTLKPRHVNAFVSKYYPEFKSDISTIFDRCSGDIRLILNNIAYSDFSSIIISRKYKTPEIAAALFYEKNRSKVFKMLQMSDDPWWFSLSWIRYNSPKVYKSMKKVSTALSTLEYVSKNKHKMNKDFLIGILTYGIPLADIKTMLRFPTILRKKKQTEETTVKPKITKGKIKNTKKPKSKPKPKSKKLNVFMV